MSARSREETANVSARSLSGDEITLEPRRTDEQATQIIAVLDRYLEALKAGQRPDRQQLLAENPQIADQLEACLAGVEFIHGSASAQPSGKRLGEFRIIREIGHGGMGAVYEAEQISLGRRVALKVLRFGAVSDAEAITRFQREAETIGRLHHTNIVPIFAVGSENGVNYYAMQYIVGRSLDQVLRESGKPIAARTVAEWGLQAAEALAHAHARGVVHRDVKPSNLLIDDEEGRIWLTDFGLAKRLDDVTLSMTGALLGTPRYMSPEQAAAAHNKLDHRTDLYSLGATLYELVTGQPVFKGDSPHNVILQILEAEPVPPRRHLPALPRDLDTILMKCLAKEPSRRYSSARELADDLRAFLDSRSIAARRAGPVERAVRWVHKQQRSLVLTIGAVVATLSLVAGSVAGSYFWQRSRLAFVKLDSDHPPVVAEILTSSGQSVTPRTTLPMQQAAEVPAGEYQLRLHADQRFSQDYSISLSPGQYVVQKLDVEEQLLWSDFKYQRTFRPVLIAEPGATPIGQSTDLLLLNQDGVQRCDGQSRATLWTLDLEKPTHELLTKNLSLRWPWDNTSSVAVHGVGVFDDRPFVVSAGDARGLPFDFNGDNVSDIVLAARHQAWMMAVSGSDGSPLWVAAHGDALPLPDGQSWNAYGINSAVLYAPLVVADQDGDNVADLAMWFATTDAQRPTIARRLDLVSGKTGATIWKYEAPDALFALPAMVEPPQDFRWYHGSGGGYGGSGSGGGQDGVLTRRYRSNLSRSAGRIDYLPSSPIVVGNSPSDQRATATLEFLAGTQWVKLNLASGKPLRAPIDMAIRTTLAPRWADFDGDAEIDVLLATDLPALPAGVGGTPTPQLQLTAWSAAKHRALWQVTVDTLPAAQPSFAVEAPIWPIATDLDGNGSAEVIVPEKSSISAPTWSAPWGTLAVLDGRTGMTRWRRQLRNVDQQLDTFAVGPDVNGDGRLEVFVASLWNENYELFVDCLSGENGESLWRARSATREGLRTSEAHRLAPLAWYDGVSSHLPQLVVRLNAESLLLSNVVMLFSAEDGQQRHVANGIMDAPAGDLDGNGLAELLLVRPNNSQSLDSGGTLHAIRGPGPERWRRLAAGLRPLFDFDSDGVIDLVESHSDGRLVARSGVTSEVLWSTTVSHMFALQPAPKTPFDPTSNHGQDLNGDGTPDVLLTRIGTSYPDPEPFVTVLSGSNGRVLWRGEVICHTVEQPALLEVRDLDGDGEPEVICAAPVDLDLAAGRRTFGSNDTSLWLIVLSGRTGKTRFSEKLVNRPSSGNSLDLRSLWLECSYADLNRDGVLDLILPGSRPGADDLLEMRAISGRDGVPLWQYALPPDDQRHDALRTVMPTVIGDLDGNGKTDVVISSVTTIPLGQYATQNAIRLSVLEGDSGKLRWHHDVPSERYAYARVETESQLLNRARPILVRRSDREHWIALLSFKGGYSLRLFDAAGKIVAERSLTPAASPWQFPYRLWTCDVENDGGDELVLFEGDALTVVAADKLDQPHWRSTPNEWVYGAVQRVLQDAEGGPQIVVRGPTNDVGLFGLSAATGRKLWTCAAPNLMGDNWATMIAPPGEKRAPLAHYYWNNVSLVREGTDFDGHEERAPEKLGRVQAGQDPRLLRSMPWAISEDDAWREVRSCLWAILYGITMLGIPGAYVGSIIYRRRFGLRTLLLLPVVAGVFLMGAMIHGPDGVHRVLLGKFVVGGLVGGPIIVALSALAFWTWRRNWRTVGGWLAVGPMLALLVITVLLVGYFPKHEGPMATGERWSWEGWHWVIVYSYFATAWLMTVLIPTWSLGCFLWRRMQGGGPIVVPET